MPRKPNNNIKEIEVKGFKIYFNTDTHRFWRFDEVGNKITIPSVTSFTGIIDKSPQLIPWAINLFVEHLTLKIEGNEVITAKDVYEGSQLHRVRKQEAADIGSIAHEWISQWLKGEDPALPENKAAQQVVSAFLEYQDKENIQWEQSEEIVYYNDGTYEFAGIFDALAKIGKKTVLVDFKSSNGIYTDYVFQVAAYQLAWEWMHNKKIHSRMIIRLAKESADEYYARMKKKGYEDCAPYQSVEAKTYDENLKDQMSFLACVTLKNRIKELED